MIWNTKRALWLRSLSVAWMTKGLASSPRTTLLTGAASLTLPTYLGWHKGETLKKDYLNLSILLILLVFNRDLENSMWRPSQNESPYKCICYSAVTNFDTLFVEILVGCHWHPPLGWWQWYWPPLQSCSGHAPWENKMVLAVRTKKLNQLSNTTKVI